MLDSELRPCRYRVGEMNCGVYFNIGHITVAVSPDARLDARNYGVGGTMPGAPDDPFETWLEISRELRIGEMYEALIEYQSNHGPQDFDFYFVEAPDFVQSAFHRLVDELEADQHRWLAMHGTAG